MTRAELADLRKHSVLCALDPAAPLQPQRILSLSPTVFGCTCGAQQRLPLLDEIGRLRGIVAATFRVLQDNAGTGPAVPPSDEDYQLVASEAGKIELEERTARSTANLATEHRGGSGSTDAGARGA